MLPTDVLQQEHRLIERMLLVLERTAERLERGKTIPPAVFGQILDFIRNFSDSCHHGKEEDVLFPLLERRGIGWGGPVGVMLMEHEEGRRLVRKIDEAIRHYTDGRDDAKEVLIDNSRGFIQLLRQHIFKEDNILYPMANRVLSSEDQEDLQASFESVEQDKMGEGKHQYYIDLVEKMERQ